MRKLQAAAIAILMILCFPVFGSNSETTSGWVGQNTYDIFPDGHARYAGHWYLLVPDKEPWGYANRFALDHGGYLCCIGDYHEQNFLNLYNHESKGMWLGAVYENGEWSWLSGEEWSYVSWQNGVVPGGEAPSNAALIHGRMQQLAYNETDLISGYLVEFDTEEACLSAMADFIAGSFSKPASALADIHSTRDNQSDVSASLHAPAPIYTADDRFPFGAAAAAAVFLFAAFLIAIDQIAKKRT